MTLRTFAYGSNLDRADLESWCARNGRTNPLTRPPVRALLPDHRYAFHYFSHGRGGGALDVVPARGHVVEGAVFELEEDDLTTLDAKEGAPHHYRRQDVRVITAGGRLESATTYTVLPARRRAEPVTPTAAYLDAVRRGMAAYGLGGAENLEAAAEGRPQRPSIDGVFVYGTLMRGECRAGFMGTHVRDVRAATTSGQLHDLGDYPALVLTPGGEERVRGELHRSADIARLLASLDPVEDFGGFDRVDNLYERTVVEVTTQDGERVRAWTYVMLAAPSEGRRIDGRDWRRRHDGPATA